MVPAIWSIRSTRPRVEWIEWICEFIRYCASDFLCVQSGGTGLNAAFASFQCFSGDQMVSTSHGNVRMDELKVGDLVLSVDQSLVGEQIQDKMKFSDFLFPRNHVPPSTPFGTCQLSTDSDK